MAAPTGVPVQPGGPGDAGTMGSFRGGPPGGFGGGRPRGLFFMGGPVVTIVLLATLVVLAIAFYQIYRKAGLNGLLGLLMLIPGVNLVMMLWFAFAEWPVLKQLREQRAIVAMHAAEAGVAASPVMPSPAVAEAVAAPESGAPPSPPA